MADFCLWVEATAPSFGWPPEVFLESMEANRRGADAVAIEALPIGPVLIRFLDTQGTWDGTATELLALLTSLAGEQVVKTRGWPLRANSLSGQLRRLAPNLRQLGIGIDLQRSGKSGQRRLRLTKNDAPHDRQHRQPAENVPESPVVPLTIPPQSVLSANRQPPLDHRQPASADRQPSPEKLQKSPHSSSVADDADETDDGSPPAFLSVPRLQTDFGDDMEEVTL
jgi:hypothetical protein